MLRLVALATFDDRPSIMGIMTTAALLVPRNRRLLLRHMARPTRLVAALRMMRDPSMTGTTCIVSGVGTHGGCVLGVAFFTQRNARVAE